ncbi:MAG: DinB family protein [Flavisolibacter sp.]
MKKEIQYLAEQCRDAWEGDPWFGRNALTLLREVGEDQAFERPGDQHSILELVWHMITWKTFALSRLQKENRTELYYFEANDWRELDHSDKTLWRKGLEHLYRVQEEWMDKLQQQDDALLDQEVPERNYNFRKLLNGVLQHDIYHLGQIAFLKKLIDGNSR